MQYEMILISLMAFGCCLLGLSVYLNSQKLKQQELRLTKIENELAEWGKEIEKE